MIIVKIIMLLCFIYLSGCTLYLLIFAIAGLFRKEPLRTGILRERTFAILIPAYKEDSIILNTVQHAINQRYPQAKFELVVIADQLKDETIALLKELPITLMPVSFTKSTKARSLRHALQQLPQNRYDIVMILDADNIMGADCLDKTNHAFDAGFKVVQLHRTAKNKNTPTAILDAISEEINNHIFRKGHRALGLSSALIGSGMAFDYQLFKSLMANEDIENNPGEDREINLELLRQGLVCEYIEDAYIYDEKVQSNAVLERQRIRWLSAQLQYAKRCWLEEPLKTLSHGIHYADFALQTLFLPRSLLLMTILAMAVLNMLLKLIPGMGIIYPAGSWWGCLFGGCLLSLIISMEALPLLDLKKGLISFPHAFWAFFRALTKSNSKQREFIHTPKQYIHAEDS